MNYCPECGHILGFDKLEKDVATDHYYYTCHGNVRHKWEETLDKSGGLLHIAPVEEDKD